MGSVKKSHLVRIGNSRGVRIPKVWLEQLGFSDEVEMAVQADQLVIRSARRPREGWEAKFWVMHERGDDRPIEELPASAWDEQRVGVVMNRFDVYLVALDPDLGQRDQEDSPLPDRFARRGQPPSGHGDCRPHDDQRARLSHSHLLHFSGEERANCP